MSATRDSEIRVIQVTIHLGSRQKVVLRADNRISTNPSQGPVQYKRSGTSGSAGGGDLPDLVHEVLTKTAQAFKNGDKTMELCVDGSRIVLSDQCD